VETKMTEQRKKIIAYDDDISDIQRRYLPLARDNDISVIYFARLCGQKLEDFVNRTLPNRLELCGISRELIFAALDHQDLIKLRFDPETSEIPFPQDADVYFVDGLAGGSRAVAAKLPKERVTVISKDYETILDAQRLGYKTISEF